MLYNNKLWTKLRKMMATDNERLKQMLTFYVNTSAQLLSLDENDPKIIKRRLKIIRGLCFASHITLNDINELTESQTMSIVKEYQAIVSLNPVLQSKVAAKNNTDFFHLSEINYPYHNDIIPMSKSTTTKATQGSKTAPSVASSTGSKSIQTVHGCQLNENEQFSSTRYYSEDKTSYGQVLAKNGTFQAVHHNLNEEQKKDLVLETAFQFFIDLKAGTSSVSVTGAAPMAHKLKAALLYFQRELGPAFNERFPDLKIKLPESLQVDITEPSEQYITSHLGTMPPPPRQLAQLHSFLSHQQKENALVSPKQQAIVDLERCLASPELTQDDKKRITDYLLFLQQYTTLSPTEPPNNETYIAQEEALLLKTQEVLACLKKSPYLQRDCAALEVFYNLSVTSHQETKQKLSDLEREYHKKLDPLKKEQQRAFRAGAQAFIDHGNLFMSLSLLSNQTLSDSQCTALRQCDDQLKQIQQFVERDEPFSDEEKNALFTQMHTILNLLEANDLHKNFPELDSYQTFFNERAVTPKAADLTQTHQEQTKKTPNSDTLLMKEKLSGMKKENAQKITLTQESIRELRQLAEEATDFITSNESLSAHMEGKNLINLLSNLGDLETKGITNEQVISLTDCIDLLLPLMREQQGGVHILMSLKELISPTHPELRTEENNCDSHQPNKSM